MKKKGNKKTKRKARQSEIGKEGYKERIELKSRITIN